MQKSEFFLSVNEHDLIKFLLDLFDHVSVKTLHTFL